MTYKPLDTVVLTRDQPQHSLREGDLGVVVETYDPDGLEVEFVSPSGETRAVLTLKVRDVRSVAADDIASVRSA
jgi:hypothetical protein